MSAVAETTMNVTRRTFLKTGAIVAGGMWLGSAVGCSSGSGGGGEGSQAGSGETICNGVCRPNCFSTCMMNVHVREGKIVKTSPADFPDTSFNRICLRGLSHVENVYHPDRVLYPIKQTGERGSDNWERVSWDEALDDIAEKLTSLRKEFGDSSIFKASGSSVYHVTNGSVATFFNEINASSMTADLDKSNYLGINRVYGFAGLWPANDPHDYVNAKTIFLWGNNLTDAQIHDWHFVADAMEQGTYVVCIDPTYTQMAAKSDRFIPIRPGADLPLIMAMMYVIVEEDLVDWDFMTKHTCAPFLVKSTDGLFLRMSDLGVEPKKGDVNPATGEPTIIDPYVVWDPAANAAAELSTVAAPALEGTFDVGGVSCTTAYTLLKNEIMKYTPDYAATMCDVPAETIIELAHLAADGPVTHRVGWGAQAYDNGIHPHHAGAALGALTGQLGKPGANYGPAPWLTFNYGNAAFQAPSSPVTSPTVSCMYMADVMESGKFQEQSVTPKALWVYSGNPLCTWVDTNTLRDEVFKKMELVVTVDNMMTDTARWSDYVLPLAHWFEYEDAVVFGNTYHVLYSGKAADPLGESKCDLDIMRTLAGKMGLRDDLYPASNEEYLRTYFDNEACAEMGISYDALVEQHAIRCFPENFRMWEGGNFLTPSGRAEFYVEKPVPSGFVGVQPDLSREHLPTWFEPREAWPDNPLHETYPFILMSERPRFRVHGQWAYNRILRELDPEPTVKMNPADAAAKGLKDGQHVECFNDHGHAVAKLVYNEAVRPGTLVYPKSWQSDQHLAGGWSEPLSRACDPVAVNQSFMDCLVDIRAWEGAE